MWEIERKRERARSKEKRSSGGKINVCVRQNRQYHHIEISFKLTSVCYNTWQWAHTNLYLDRSVCHFASSHTASYYTVQLHEAAMCVCAVHVWARVLYIFLAIYSRFVMMFTIVSYRWDFLWANQSFAQHKSDKVKRKWLNIENNLCHYLAKHLRDYFSLHSLYFTSFFSLTCPEVSSLGHGHLRNYHSY